MRSVPESLTVEEVEERKAWVAALYPDEVVQEIIQKSHLSVENDVADTKEFLLKAGYWYIDHKDVRNPGTSYLADRTQLESIAAAASGLATSLSGLSEVSARTLWHPFHHSWQFASPWVEHGSKTAFGLTIKKYPQSDGSIAVQHLKPADIEEALDVLHHLAASAADSFPLQKGGQPQDLNRHNWTVSALHFWRGHSDIAFDYRSIAFNFCQLGFCRLDPNVSHEQIASAMRAAAKQFPDGKPHSPGAAPVQEP